MKKKNTKIVLNLKKKTISNLELLKYKGGLTGGCSGPTVCFPGHPPTADGGSNCKCK